MMFNVFVFVSCFAGSIAYRYQSSVVLKNSTLFDGVYDGFDSICELRHPFFPVYFFKLFLPQYPSFNLSQFDSIVYHCFLYDDPHLDSILEYARDPVNDIRKPYKPVPFDPVAQARVYLYTYGVSSNHLYSLRYFDDRGPRFFFDHKFCPSRYVKGGNFDIVDGVHHSVAFYRAKTAFLDYYCLESDSPRPLDSAEHLGFVYSWYSKPRVETLDRWHLHLITQVNQSFLIVDIAAGYESTADEIGWRIRSRLLKPILGISTVGDVMFFQYNGSLVVTSSSGFVLDTIPFNLLSSGISALSSFFSSKKALPSLLSDLIPSINSAPKPSVGSRLSEIFSKVKKGVSVATDITKASAITVLAVGVLSSDKFLLSLIDLLYNMFSYFFSAIFRNVITVIFEHINIYYCFMFYSCSVIGFKYGYYAASIYIFVFFTLSGLFSLVKLS